MNDDAQVAAMLARGWEHDAEMGDYFARGVDGEHRVLMLRVRRWSSNGKWMADYGTAGVSFAPIRPEHDDPERAADEAEAWLRRVLSGLRFPWLVGAHPPGADREGGP